MKKYLNIGATVVTAALFLTLVACSTMKTSATADVAVSTAAFDSAVSAGGAEFAPVEMSTAREKLRLANAAMAAKDYQLASDLANQAQVDATLAQSKAGSAKAQVAANAVQEDIRILREELTRANALKK